MNDVVVSKVIRDWPWLLTIVFLIIFGIVLNIDEIWLVTNDDLQISFRGYQFWQTAAENQGRLAHYINGFFAQAPYLSDSFFYFKSIQILPIILAIVLFSLLVGMIFRNQYVGYIQAGMLAALWQNSHGHNLLSSYPFYSLSSFIFLLLSCVYLILHIRTQNRVYLIVSVLLWFGTLKFSEVWHLYLLVLLSVAMIELMVTNTPRLKKEYFNIIRWYIFISLVNLAGYLIFRYFNSSIYEGNVINWNLGDILSTCYTYSVGLFPGYQYYLNLPTLSFVDFVTSRASLNLIFTDLILKINVYCLLVAVVIFILLYFSRQKLKLARERLNLALMFVFSLIYVFIPNILISLTSKYQGWVLESSAHDYLYSAYSFFSISLCFVVLAIYLSKWKVLYVFFSLVVVILSILVQVNNATVEDEQVKYSEKFWLMNTFLTGKVAQEQGSPLDIYAPSLWDFNTFREEYWTDYSRNKTGSEISISRTQRGNSQLTFVESNKEKRSYLLFSKKGQLRAIFYFSDYCNNSSCALITSGERIDTNSVMTKGGRHYNRTLLPTARGINTPVSMLEVDHGVLLQEFISIDGATPPGFFEPVIKFLSGVYEKEIDATGESWWWAYEPVEISIKSEKDYEAELSISLRVAVPMKLSFSQNNGMIHEEVITNDIDETVINMQLHIGAGTNVIRVDSNKMAIKLNDSDPRLFLFQIREIEIE